MARHVRHHAAFACYLFAVVVSLLLLTTSAQDGPIVIPPSPAVPTFSANPAPTELPFPAGCAEPNWNADDPTACLMPVINGVIYDGPYNAVWDPDGVWSKWVIRSDRSKTPIVGIHVAQVPSSDVFLYIGRTSEISFSDNSGDILAGYYDLATDTFENVTTTTSPFCSGVGLTHDGRILNAGGTTAELPGGQPDGRNVLRVYDYNADKLSLPGVGYMSGNRWYPTVTLLHDNTHFIIGGTQEATEYGTPNGFFERWSYQNPSTTVSYALEPTFQSQMGQQFYPSVFVLPNRDLFILQDQHSRIIKPSGEFRLKDGQPVEGTLYPPQWKTQFPHIGTAAMTALTWEDNFGSVDIVFFGGTPTEDSDDIYTWCPTTNNIAKTKPANRYSYRMKITWNLVGSEWEYSFGDWVEEDMGIPRVGGDATLLPNGDIVISGGAQTGCSCGIREGVNRGNYPALWPLLYQPDRPAGERYTVLQASSIARMYHGTAALTTSGTILIQGCDACDQATIVSTAPWWSGNPDQTWEFRVEEFFPPYALDYNYKPAITSVAGITDGNPIDIYFDATFDITWAPSMKPDGTLANVTDISSVSLSAPSSVTHGFDTNQRIVFLRIVNKVDNTLTVQMPSGDQVAVLPPQVYKLFINNGKTYSTAWWVRVNNPAVLSRRRTAH